MNAVAPLSRRSRVRAARESDLSAVVKLLLVLHEETPHAPLDFGRLVEGVDECFRTGAILLALDEATGRPVGTVGLQINAPWFSREEWLSDLWFFVHPAHRRTAHARTMLEECRATAERLGLPLQMSVTGWGARIAGKIRLFSRVLGQPVGAIWNLRSA